MRTENADRRLAEISDRVAQLPGVAVPRLDDVRDGAHLCELEIVDEARVMNAAPSMLSTRGANRSAAMAIDRASPWTVLTVIALTAGRRVNAAFAGGSTLTSSPRVNGNSSSPSMVQLLNGEEPLAILRAELGQAIGDDVDHRAGLERAIERAAHAEVQGQIVCGARERPSAPRGRRHHPDAGDQHIDLIRTVSVSDHRSPVGGANRSSEQPRAPSRRRSGCARSV